MKISVIVPVYNVKDYVEKCVKSIQNQTYQDLEIILVDDGSTDKSGVICDQLAIHDNRIKVIHKKNAGLSSARNIGIEMATGEYLGFVDSDDYVESNMFEIMLHAIITTQKDIACCGRYVDVSKKFVKTEFCYPRIKKYKREEAIKELFYLRELDVSACDKLYNKKIFDKIRYPEGKINEDAAIIFDVIQASNGVVHVGKPLYHYMYRVNSISKKKYNENRFDVIDNLYYSMNFTKNNYPAFEKDCLVYCSITTGSILLSMYHDKETIKKFHRHYKRYLELFNLGFVKAIISNKVKIKMKIRLIAVKTHAIGIFYLGQSIYHKFYVIMSKHQK